MIRYLQYLALRRYKTPSKDSEKKSEKDLKKDSKDSKSPYPGGQRAKNDPRDEDGKTSMRDDTLAVGDNPRLVVRGFNGRIRVRAGEPGSIRVRTRLKKPRGIKYRAVQEGDLVTVEAKPDQPYKQSEGFLHGLSRQSLWSKH